MKQLLCFCIAMVLTLSLASCSAETTDLPSTESSSTGKTLIAYFSLIDIVPEGADASAHATPSIGSTEAAAQEIQRQVGGDLFAIHTVQTYSVSHREDSARYCRLRLRDCHPL